MEELDAFRQRLDTHFPDLTKSEQRIASYLLASYDQAAFLPAVALAERLDVSEATIVRFARSIGFDGFPELRRTLEAIFRAKITPASRLQRKLADLRDGQGHILTKIIDMEIEYLTEALHNVSTDDFDRAVEIILSGRRVFVLALGASHFLAELVEFRLRRFGVPVVSLTESGRDLCEKLVLLQPDDVLLATGFQLVSNELMMVMTHAHSLGCRTVFVTDTLGPTFRDKAEVILSARRGPVSTFHSLTVPMAILNAFILAIAMYRPEQSVATLDRLQSMRELYGLDGPERNPAHSIVVPPAESHT